MSGADVNTSITFTQDKPKESFTVLINTNGNGTWISGGGTFEEGSICMVSAINGNGFEGWYDRTDGGMTFVTTSRNYHFTVRGDRLLFAKYN